MQQIFYLRKERDNIRKKGSHDEEERDYVW